MTHRKPDSFQDQAEQRSQAEALRIAKSTQVRGQNKEQTKLIAKGIEKGIAFYKQQQKTRARELDKARKKALKQRPVGEADLMTGQTGYDAGVTVVSTKLALIVSAVLYSMASIAHATRYLLGWDVAVGAYSVPLLWSAAIALLGAVLAAWMFRLASTQGKECARRDISRS